MLSNRWHRPAEGQTQYTLKASRMFFNTEPTQYDLRFNLFNIPVRISAWFWLMGAVFGFNAVELEAEYLLLWMGILFVSILVHEFGHALVAKAFGYRPHVLLYHFGGLAMYQPDSRYTASRSVAISLAGPSAGFALFGLTELFKYYVFPSMIPGLSRSSLMLLSFAIIQMEWINLYWGLINLLPVLPLDGGRICQEICLKISPRRGVIYAAQTGAVVSGVAAAFFFTQEMLYPAILFASLCATNIQAAQQRQW
ncbi:MAG: hypothetical protein HON04_12095 [Planctomicrobium sp.]|nr:hypothetical protein [Planctomicrobium sp.]